MPQTLIGAVVKGYGCAGRNLRRVLPLIQERSGLALLLPNTLNLKLNAEFSVQPDFTISPSEYNGSEELRFQRCSIHGLQCLVVRPDTHEAGQFHGRAYLEIMCESWLRDELGLRDGDPVEVVFAK